MGWKIRKAETKDISSFMSLFRAYTASAKTEYFFHWWNGIPSVTYCAIHDDEIIGMFVVLRRKLANGLNCGVLMGLLVKTEWRGSGVFKDLGEAAMNHFSDIDLYCCLTNAVGRKALENNFGFRTVDNIETLCLTREVVQETRPQDNLCYPVSPTTQFNSFEAVKDDTVLFVADEEFRRWRFARHPFNAYCILHIPSGEFALANKYRDPSKGITYGDIADYEVRSLDEKHIMDLLSRITSELHKQVNTVTIQAVPQSLPYRAAKQLGFVENGVTHRLCLKTKDTRHKYLYEPSNWLIKWGDYLR